MSSLIINQDVYDGYESDAEIEHKNHLRNIESLTAFYADEAELNLSAEEKALRDAEYGITAAEYEFWLMFEIRGYEDGTKGTTEVKRRMAAATQTDEEDATSDDDDIEDDEEEDRIREMRENDLHDRLQNEIEDYADGCLSDEEY